nr:trypsin-like peptidase domain-containing protein [Streptomyces sp. CC228A]
MPEPPAGRVAEVVHWVGIDRHGRGDVAVLRLRDPAPEGARPLPVAAPGEVWDHRTRTVGFTGGEPGERWFRGRLGGATAEGWLQLSRADGQTTRIEEGFSGSPVWDDEVGAVVGLVVATLRGEDAQAFVLHMRTVLGVLPPDLASLLDPPSPFRGLAAYQEDDEDVFFGRHGDVEEVAAALRGGHRAVTLYGPSGCGKSSVARAGVVPRMRRAGYEVLVVDAGKVSSPRAALAVELYERVRQERYGPPRAGGVDEVEGRLAAHGLADTLHRLRGDQDGRLLVVLDQAEALLDRTDAELAQTVDLLFPERAAGGTRVLLTLRADFMDAVLKHPRLGPALRSGRTLPLTPMSAEQLREVVVRPVERVPAVEYDPGLVERILSDAGDDPGVLPLLGFVLGALWERRSCGRLPAAAYEEMGGVSGALKQHAAAAWKACTGTRGVPEAEALRLLTGLVRVLPGSGRRCGAGSPGRRPARPAGRSPAPWRRSGCSCCTATRANRRRRSWPTRRCSRPGRNWSSGWKSTRGSSPPARSWRTTSTAGSAAGRPPTCCRARCT